MSDRGFPKCFSGSRPGTHVGNMHKDRNTQTPKEGRGRGERRCERGRGRGSERERSDQEHRAVIGDDRRGGLRAVTQTHM